LKALVEITRTRIDRAFLVGAELKSRTTWEVADALDELAELASTAGADIAGRATQKLVTPNAGTYIGAGKAAELAAECDRLRVDTVIFDDDLTPAQGRNLEKAFNRRVLDRTNLILNIFAQRARTREGKLQVELAQLEYLLPRLTRYWTHLSRQRGSTGSIGGEGESQLESDRRKIQERIDKIREELAIVRRQRGTQRAGRQRQLWPLASIVGYTNAGKSTLLNRLTGAGVLAEDKLFATLDPTTRRLRLPTNQNALLSDTVGFIRKLPHGLVEAFKATLEEVVRADLLVHVVDLSHPHAQEQIHAVNDVLREIGAEGKPTIMVFNKLDRLADRAQFNSAREQFPNAVGISAKTGEGVEELLGEIGRQLRPIREFLELKIPHAEAAAMARLHAVAQIVEKSYRGAHARFKARIPPHLHAEFERFVVRDLDLDGAEK
jgi:GTP-binding protein HflX